MSLCGSLPVVWDAAGTHLHANWIPEATAMLFGAADVEAVFAFGTDFADVRVNVVAVGAEAVVAEEVDVLTDCDNDGSDVSSDPDDGFRGGVAGVD